MQGAQQLGLAGRASQLSQLLSINLGRASASDELSMPYLPGCLEAAAP
jgi:hypothetical protein